MSDKKRSVIVICLLIVFLFAITFIFFISISQSLTIFDNKLRIHFLELGNNYTGDCTYISYNDIDILVDAGSRKSSATTITKYLTKNMKDNVLEYVIATHADQDHIAGFVGENNNGIFDVFNCKTIIDFPRTNKDTVIYNNYVTKRNNEITAGAVHYTALECYNQQNGAKKIIQLAENLSIEILYNYYYENYTSNENDYSVCFVLKHQNKKFLFTGDLEEQGEQYLIQYNDLETVSLYKAGHHGSKTSSTLALLDVIKPEICCVTAVAGSVEYLTTVPQNLFNSFPTQNFINNISRYTNKVYVTSQGMVSYNDQKGKFVDVGYSSLNGNIVVESFNNKISVNCSNNNTKLKDSKWFLNNRDMPSSWQ